MAYEPTMLQRAQMADFQALTRQRDDLLAWLKAMLESATEDERCDENGVYCGHCLYCAGRDLLARIDP